MNPELAADFWTVRLMTRRQALVCQQNLIRQQLSTIVNNLIRHSVIIKNCWLIHGWLRQSRLEELATTRQIQIDDDYKQIAKHHQRDFENLLSDFSELLST